MTIQEMALEHYPNTGNWYDDANNAKKRIGFIEGANAVLKEIEKIIDYHEDGCLALESIQLKISELKGE